MKTNNKTIENLKENKFLLLNYVNITVVIVIVLLFVRGEMDDMLHTQTETGDLKFNEQTGKFENGIDNVEDLQNTKKLDKSYVKSYELAEYSWHLFWASIFMSIVTMLLAIIYVKNTK